MSRHGARPFRSTADGAAAGTLCCFMALMALIVVLTSLAGSGGRWVDVTVYAAVTGTVLASIGVAILWRVHRAANPHAERPVVDEEDDEEDEYSDVPPVAARPVPAQPVALPAQPVPAAVPTSPAPAPAARAADVVPRRRVVRRVKR